MSSKEQIEGTSLETQERQCREYANRHSWAVSQVYVELGESAKTADRTEFAKAINYCCEKKGRVDYFVVYKIDRFSRKAEDHLMVRAVLSKAGTELRSVMEPINESATGKLMETVIAGFAEFDNNVRAERTKSGMRQRVEEGYWVWAPQLGFYKPNKGKKTHIVPDPAYVPYVRMAFEEFRKGGRTYRAIQDFLTRQGLLTRRGKPIKLQEVQKMLRNPIYCGIIRAFGRDWPGGFEPIISKELFFACQQKPGTISVLSAPRSAENPTFPLRKIITCMECGNPITGSATRGRKGKRYPYYHHWNRECMAAKSIPKHVLEDAFLAHLERIKPNVRYLQLFKAVIIDIWESNYQTLDQQNAAARKRIEKLEQERQQVFKLHREKIYSDAEFLEQKAAIARQLDEQHTLIEDRRVEEFKMEEVMDFCMDYLTNVAEKWRGLEDNYPARIRFQNLLFKSKLPFDGKTFGTAELSPIFEQKTNSRGEKSLLVARRGVEPLFPH